MRPIVMIAFAAALVVVPACGDNDDFEPRSVDRSTTTLPDRKDGEEAPAATTTATSPAPPDSTSPPATGELDQRPQPPVSTAPAFQGACASNEASAPDRLAVDVCQIGRSATSVTIRVTATDGNAVVRDDCASPSVEWGDGPTPVCQIGCIAESAEPKSLDRVFTHDYDTPGSHHIIVNVESNCGEGPRGERVAVELDVING